MDNIAAIVVTYNRKYLLSDCLNKILNQSHPVQRIFVIDNASTDGTREWLEQEKIIWDCKVRYHRLDHNTGCSGGIKYGIELAMSQKFDWLWIMDDDTIATHSALHELILAESLCRKNLSAPKILASKVLWTDEGLHPMNRPRFYVDRYEEFMQSLSEGLMLIRATSFVSLLLHRSAVDSYGLPLEHYFIWNDDSEFTARILKKERGYLVPNSIVYHKTKTKEGSVSSAHPERYYYHVRNTIFMMRSKAWYLGEKVRLFLSLFRDTRTFFRINSVSAMLILRVGRGVFDGLFLERWFKRTIK